MSFKLSTKIIQVLREVHEHNINVMEGFEIISEELSKEFDEFEREIMKRYEDD